MGHNIEIKARVADLPALAERARALATRGPEILEQEDTFFPCAHGRLKLRRFSDTRGELIPYQRPDATGPKTSDYMLVPTETPDALLEALGRALGVEGVVRKRRTVYWVGRTRVHLDEVDGLGSFLELEVVLEEGESAASGAAEAERLMGELGVDASALVEGAYHDLLRQR